MDQLNVFSRPASASQFNPLTNLLRTVVIPTPDCAENLKRDFHRIVKRVFSSIYAGLSSPRNTILLPHLVAAIPDITKCFVAFNRLFVVAPESSFSVDNEVLTKMLFPFVYLTDHVPHVNRAFAELPGFVDCFVRLWSLSLRAQTSTPLIPMYWAVLRLVVFNRPNCDGTPAFVDFKAALDGQPRQLLARSCIQRLAESTEDPNMRFCMLSALRLCSRASPDLCRHLLASDALRWVFVVLRHVMPRDIVTSAACAGIYDDVAEVVVFVSQAVSNGWSWIAEAIRCGLLEWICRCQPLLDHIQNATQTPSALALVDFIIGFLDSANRHTIYREVLRETQASMKKLGRRNVEEQMDPTGPLRRAWDALNCTLQQRLRVKAHLLQSAGRYNRCDYQKCTNSLSTRSQECAGCRTTYFCSRSCQKKSWKSDHRDECKIRQRERQDRDWQFIQAVVDDDIPLCDEKLYELDNDFPRQGQSAVNAPRMLFIDYVHVPRKITVTAVDRIEDFDDWETLGGPGEHRRIDTRSTHSLVYVRIPDGAKSVNVVRWAHYN
ncbi:hypothetical protein BDZ89DRAFT_1039027 [Hymenopellis radicata]|nr:hypothetical protein BDZ89DRAFT_1039027 [Hymenopellis radicata]